MKSLKSNRSVSYGPSETEEDVARQMVLTTDPVDIGHRLEQGEALGLIDVREPEDYERGHIPGAKNLPKHSWNNPANIKPDRVNVFYCYSRTCHLAAEAAEHFADEGFEVMELEGGFEAWKENKLPVER